MRAKLPKKGEERTAFPTSRRREFPKSDSHGGIRRAFSGIRFVAARQHDQGPRRYCVQRILRGWSVRERTSSASARSRWRCHSRPVSVKQFEHRRGLRRGEATTFSLRFASRTRVFRTRPHRRARPGPIGLVHQCFHDQGPVWPRDDFADPRGRFVEHIFWIGAGFAERFRSSPRPSMPSERRLVRG